MRWMLLALVVLPGCDEEAAKRRDQAAALGASYPEGTEGVGLLVDMLDDDDASVREAAAKSLAALGRKGLAELVHYLKDTRDPSYRAFLRIGEVHARLGAALVFADIAAPMSADQPAESRRAGAAGAILAAAFDDRDHEVMIDILIAARRDPDTGVTAMASASLAVLGWTVVAGARPASATDVKGIVPMLGDPSVGVSWPSHIGACAITLLVPRAEWPAHVADYGYAWGEAGPRDPPPIEALRERLRQLGESAPSPGDLRREGDLRVVLMSLRSKKAGAAAAKPELEALLERERGIGRVEVARTLLAVVPEETEAPARALGDVVLDREPWASGEAILLLAGMGAVARPAAPALVEVLGWSEDDDGDGKDLARECATKGVGFQFVLRSKRGAASILGHLRAKEAVPALRALAGHKDARLRYRAATALRRIGNG